MLCILGCALVNVFAQGLTGKPVPHPEGARKSTAAKRELKTLRRGVQMRSPARCPSFRIGDHGGAGLLITDNYAQQVLLRGPSATSDACAHRFVCAYVRDVSAGHFR